MRSWLALRARRPHGVVATIVFSPSFALVLFLIATWIAVKAGMAAGQHSGDIIAPLAG